jgi:hypothetical protein
MKAVEANANTLREHMVGTYHSLHWGIAAIGAQLRFLLLVVGGCWTTSRCEAPGPR